MTAGTGGRIETGSPQKGTVGAEDAGHAELQEGTPGRDANAAGGQLGGGGIQLEGGRRVEALGGHAATGNGYGCGAGSGPRTGSPEQMMLTGTGTPVGTGTTTTTTTTPSSTLFRRLLGTVIVVVSAGTRVVVVDVVVVGQELFGIALGGLQNHYGL